MLPLFGRKNHGQRSKLQKLLLSGREKNIKNMFDEIEVTIRPKLNENSQLMFLNQTSDVLASMDAKYPDMPIATKISLLESSRLFLQIFYF